jgi:hypothetical protein
MLAKKLCKKSPAIRPHFVANIFAEYNFASNTDIVMDKPTNKPKRSRKDIRIASFPKTAGEELELIAKNTGISVQAWCRTAIVNAINEAPAHMKVDRDALLQQGKTG